MSKVELTTIVNDIKQKIRCDELFLELYPEHFRQSGNSLCPFHDDHNASFAVHETFGKCHAGCKPPGKKSWDIFSLWQAKHDRDFKTALKVLAGRCGVKLPRGVNHQWNDLGDPVAHYDYHDAEGNVLFRVNRYAITNKRGKPDKTFLQSQPDGKGDWIYNLKGVQLVLFGLPELLSADADEPVLIVEGEKDVLTARRLGFTATTNPMGAGKWPSQCKVHDIRAPLKNRLCWVIPDEGDTGFNHADDIASSLRRFARSVKIIELPNLPPKGDLSDFVQRIGDDDRAKETILEIAARTDEYHPSLKGIEFVSCRELIEAELPPPRWIIKELLPEGLTILAGKPKSGKSWFILNLCSAVAMRMLALGHFSTVPGHVVSLCLEDNKRRLKDRLSVMLDGQEAPDNYLLITSWPPFDKGGLEQLRKTLDSDERIKLVTIDTLGRFRPRRGRQDDIYSADYGDLEQLHSLASLYEVAIVLVHHQRKGSQNKGEPSADPFDSILGSTALTGACDTNLLLNRKSGSEFDAVLLGHGRDLQQIEYALRFDRERGLWLYEGDPFELGLSAERREIRQILRDVGKPMNAKEVSQVMRKPYNTIHKTMSRMVDAGELMKAAGQTGKFMLPPEDELYGSPYELGQDKEGVQGEIYLDHM